MKNDEQIRTYVRQMTDDTDIRASLDQISRIKKPAASSGFFQQATRA
jgi:hypothetical protein